MRRGSIVALLGIGLIAGGVATAVAVIPTWLPVEASEQATRTNFLFWVVIAICIVIFAVVAAVMVYSIVKFKAAPDDLEDGPSVHGHTGLEITWPAIPLVIVTACSRFARLTSFTPCSWRSSRSRSTSSPVSSRT